MRVPGHCKISGSAVVDWLARARSARLFTGPEPYSELSAHFGEVVTSENGRKSAITGMKPLAEKVDSFMLLVR